MYIKITRPFVLFILTLSLALSACEGLGNSASVKETDEALQSIQTEMAIEKTSEAMQATQTAMAVPIIQPATEVLPTNTQPPQPTTEQTTPIPTATQELMPPTPLPTTIDETPTTEVTKTPVGTPEPTAVQKGMAKVDLYNHTGGPVTVKLVCVASECVGKTPSTYQVTFSGGKSTFYVWPGSYKITITYCGGKVVSFINALNARWYFDIPKCR